MLLPQTVEREYRFKLALRMGLPIFALIVALISHTLISNYSTLTSSFYIEAVMLLFFSIYFILYLIYKGYDVKITDDVTKTFTREYLYRYLLKHIKQNKRYTLILVSIENIDAINDLYGIKNGDKVLKHITDLVVSYFDEQKIDGYPIGHIKGGDLVLALQGEKSQYNALIELMFLKMNELKVNNIEVKVCGSLTDTNYSKDVDLLIEHLFEEMQNRKNKRSNNEEDIDPTKLELSVLNAIQNSELSLGLQKIDTTEDKEIYECFVKLKTDDNKLIYPKKYIKIVNKLGIGVDFDLVVLQNVLKSCVDEKKTIAINILPTSLRDITFLSKVKELLENRKISLIFILYEMEYFSYTERYNSIIKSLIPYGVSVAIDRVGVIHSSFLYLRELDIEYFRYDTYYSKEDKLQQNRSIIEGFNHMAHQKGIKSWIKNIETKEAYEVVKEMNMDMIQGRYIAEIENIE